jgi:hypothetical protein
MYADQDPDQNQGEFSEGRNCKEQTYARWPMSPAAAFAGGAAPAAPGAEQRTQVLHLFQDA